MFAGHGTWHRHRRTKHAHSTGLALALLQLIPSSVSTAATETAVDSERASSSAIVVALDPGHGGSNLGAAGPARGLFEKRITLALAERIRDLLRQAPGPQAVSVVLCREGDVMVPIRARARCAQESGATMFISLHANAVPSGVQPGAQHGFEVFVLGPREVEDDATLAVVSGQGGADGLWAAHEVRAAAEQSIVIAATIATALTGALGGAEFRGVKQSGAALDVLRGTATPAALVEVGFLDHPVEGLRLTTPEGREPIARALVSAILAFGRGTTLRGSDSTRTAGKGSDDGPAAAASMARPSEPTRRTGTPASSRVDDRAVKGAIPKL